MHALAVQVLWRWHLAWHADFGATKGAVHFQRSHKQAACNSHASSCFCQSYVPFVVGGIVGSGADYYNAYFNECREMRLKYEALKRATLPEKTYESGTEEALKRQQQQRQQQEQQRRQ